MADKVFQIPLYDALTVFPVDTYTAGTYRVKIGMPAGAVIISTLFAKSVTGTLSVNFFDSGPSDGTLAGERVDLGAHAPVSSGAPRSERIVVHLATNKPVIECVVTGTVEFGLHIVVAPESQTDISAFDAQLFNQQNDKGQPLAILDDSDGKFYLARGSKGVLSASTAHGFTSSLLRLSATSTWVEHTSIIGATIEVDVDAQTNKRLHVALDNSGVNYSVLAPGSSMEADVSPAGSVWIKSPNGPTTYSIWLKHEN